MVEDQGDSGPLLGRMLGARDLALGLGVVIAIDRGAPVRGWLEASALADGGDFVAALLSRHRIRPAFLPALLAIAGGAALINLWLARQLDPPAAALSRSARGGADRAQRLVEPDATRMPGPARLPGPPAVRPRTLPRRSGVSPWRSGS